jgi:peptide/nickel transport system substrate-binding protein
VVSLEPNLTTWPLNQLAVRKAVSLAINRSLIGVRGEFGYETPVTSATGLLPTQQSYVAAAYRGLNLQYNVAAAKNIMQKAGFKLGSNGIFQNSAGKQVTFTIEDPTGFVDYMTDCQLMVNELKQAGIGVTCDGVSTNAWGSDVADGKFQSTIRWSDYGNGTPYYMYNGWLNWDLSAPIGKNASDDFERWNSPASKAALQAYVAAPSAAGRAAALDKLEGIMVNDVPVIPMVDAADWGTYINKSVVGWATPQNPYSDDSPGGTYSEVVALHLRPAK